MTFGRREEDIILAEAMYENGLIDASENEEPRYEQDKDYMRGYNNVAGCE